MQTSKFMNLAYFNTRNLIHKRNLMFFKSKKPQKKEATSTSRTPRTRVIPDSRGIQTSHQEAKEYAKRV